MIDSHDVAVIGGGVVGLAILRRLALAGVRCVLLERGADILSGASKGNSALLHTAFDAPPGSVEHACMQEGYAEYLAIHERLNLPLDRSTAILVAWNTAEHAALPAIVEKAHRNGVADVQLLDAAEVRAREPLLGPGIAGGVLVPGESIIDPWSAPLAYAHQAIAHGATIVRDAEVTGGELDGTGWSLRTRKGPFRAACVVNAAGNFGDLVDGIARPPTFRITPRKGQFVVFDKRASALVNAIILPVPTERTKGVVLFRTIFGNLAIGPTAEDQCEREAPACDTASLQALQARALEMLPALAGIDVAATYAGLRPASNQADYIIESIPDRRWITVAGIRSTGLTAALGIAGRVARLYGEGRAVHTATETPIRWTPVPNLAEGRPRPYAEGGEIVCHCEQVTRGELQQALVGPLPALDLGGLKRRTRATMGRCQGFYCGAQIAALMRNARHGSA